VEVSFYHKTKGFIREVNVAKLVIHARVITLYCPDKEKHYIYPIAEITDLVIEGGEPKNYFDDMNTYVPVKE
jgi:hypothetical protein